ncbi:hypothetical protein AUJ95_02355 [Candidatus Desantisbacteria bacterium CG2_30_40_21]|uniref:Uncharacterized protein n=5 Tax=unclassified Candidatus Desantisiibacteriota TaxID=3106372 RepID=A0A2M7JCV2_9BACT|nr:MAG: hypothetical protein AUJ95_02355 [Candidatus Desantisbacteria bacterium CG2_30_40_21]PIP40182.1 MAG: hypothetical protein COX18_07510 [Candidatus Desantisbacteria bacterium CG23_combo_of_CG06-09_8_20_14_all_40_23]PIX17207.1 MAG: hypothetical protein COZ71_04510 [Candidatus Desantisbacteria bacterium CG_4_8_14_3_um_filter_40_12]PIY19800.1 MAG: hypothetical protein COZ13_03430 [Candidatus Desantisbacteria bacterium CG_4_10_14_3_um_filter_40_18]PJB29491.1 MAG: hypothetical protein CO110_05
MARNMSRDDVQKLLGALKDILGTNAETQEQDMEWKKEMENPQIDARDTIGGIENGGKSDARGATANTRYFRDIEPEPTRSKSVGSDIVNFLWIVVIVGAIGFGGWSFFSSGTAGKVMGAVKQQGDKVVKFVTGGAQK